MPPKTPEQLEADFRRQLRGSMPGIRVQSMPSRPARQPSSLAESPSQPEAQAQPEEMRQAGPTGFVGFGQLQAANVEASQRMAQQLGEAAVQSQATGLLGTEAGREALLGRGATAMDAALAGAAGGSYLEQLQQQYGPEAQERAARERALAQAEMQRRKREMDESQRRASAEQQARLQATGPEAMVTNEVNRLRSLDANRPRGQLTAERWANLHGMTLEQWVRGGKNPPY